MTNEVTQKTTSDEQNVSSSNGLEPSLRFSNFSDHWKEYRFDNVCKINPYTDELPREFYYIDLECVESGQITSALPLLHKENAPSRAQRLLKKDDILYQMVRPYQKNNYYFSKLRSKPTVASTGYAQLRCDKNCSRFIYQLLHTEKLVLNAMRRSTGTGYPAVNSSDLAEIKIALPSLPEQEKIAAFLSLVDAQIEKQRQLVEALKKYKRGVKSCIFSQHSSWNRDTADKLAHIATGSSNTQDSVADGKFPFFIRSANVARSNKYIFDGEAVLTIGDGQIGKVFHYINGKFDCHQRVYMITDFRKISGRYFYHFFSTFFYERAMKMSAKNTVDSVRMEMIAKMPIYYPSQEQQNKIVSLLDALDTKIMDEHQEQEKLELVKKGLLQQMFI